MSASPPRLPFDRCYGVSLQVLMDDATDVVPLIEITPGDIRAPEAWLEAIEPDSTAGGPLPGFIAGGGLLSSVRVSRGTATLLGIERAALAAALGRGDDPVIVSGSISRTSKRDPLSEAPFRIELLIRNASLPKPRATLKMNEQAVERRLNLAKLPPVQGGHVPVAQITIAPEGPQGPDIKGRNITAAADVRFIVRAQLRWGDLATVQASLRPHRLRDDESLRGWFNVDDKQRDRSDADDKPSNVVDDERLFSVEFDVDAERFSIDAIDIGIRYGQLREWLAQQGGRTLHVDAAMWFRIRRGDKWEDIYPAWRQTEMLELTGELQERLIFSGMGDPAPVLLSDIPPGKSYTRSLPQEPVFLDDDGVLRSGDRKRQLKVQHEGGTGVSLSAKVRLLAAGRPVPGADLAPLSNETLAASDAADVLPEPRVVPIDLPELLKLSPPLDDVGELACETTLEVTLDGEPTRTFQWTTPLKVERRPAAWLACIDFGASCTAIRIGKPGDNHAGMFLPLGEWLSDIDPFHDECGFADPASYLPGAPPRQAPRMLLPSHIGLSPHLNLRTGWDPLSLGDLALALPDEAAAGRRLRRLDRSYDISMPFPSRQKMAAHLDTIITRPKKRMIERNDMVRLRAPVFRRPPGSDKPVWTQDVDLGKVIEECFDELGYVAVSTLHRMLADGAADDTAREFARERIESKHFGVVVTHPGGIEASRRKIYQQAGLRFITAFAGPAAEAPRESDVTLVPEAMAAARYGIQKFIDAEARRNGLGNALAQTFITLDIGAGTYDVTVIDATVTAGGVRDWKVQSHFGLALGGADLDEALNDAVKNILGAAAALPRFAEFYELEPGFPLDPSDSLGVTAAGREASLQLRTAVQIAKARLSQQLLERRTAGEPYVWRSRRNGGEPLQVYVGGPGNSLETWPVRRRPAERSWDVLPELPGENFRVVCEKAADGIRLDIWPEALQEHSNRLADLVTFMGTALPELAFEEHLRRRPDRPPVWIVTGRTALWPPLFDAIRRFVEDRKAGSLLPSCPFAPDQMKQAVVYGAFGLAQTPWLLEDNTPPNPLAIIRYVVGSGDGRQRRTIGSIYGADQSEFPFVTQGPFAVARVIPSLTKSEGLDRRIDLIRRVGIAPWVDLTGEISHDEPGRWSMRCDRDGTSLRLTFISPSGRVLTLGPYEEGRVYA